VLVGRMQCNVSCVQYASPHDATFSTSYCLCDILMDSSSLCIYVSMYVCSKIVILTPFSRTILGVHTRISMEELSVENIFFDVRYKIFSLNFQQIFLEIAFIIAT
jgi:hypothetical protein